MLNDKKNINRDVNNDEELQLGDSEFQTNSGDIVLSEEEEYEYLREINSYFPVQQEIKDRFNDVLETYRTYMRRAGIDEQVLEMDEKLLKRSFYFAYKAHRHQQRINGEPYITHPVATAVILAELEVDADTLAAALLHDTIEDTVADTSLINLLFGPTITQLVEGVTKINKIQYSSKEEAQASNMRKLFMAVAEDIRVILIKLADRLHNMRTMRHQTPEKQIEKAQETLELYVPFAERLGIYRMKWELEDLCLRYIDHDAYYELVGMVASKRSEREAYIENVVNELSAAIDANGTVKHYEIEGRPKHFYSIYQKMLNKGKSIDQIYDLFACRVIVEKLADCYTVLGIVNSTFLPIDGRCKDYIALPKENNYQSIHTTVRRYDNGEPFEVQIRTYAMHKTAEYGIAAHWQYKETGGSSTYNTDKLDERMNWIRQLLETQRDSENATEFMNFLKTNISLDEVFVFTPNRDVIRLPSDSCPIDFAYAIHSNVGHHMHGAKVNGRIVPLSYKLKNGDIVEVLTSEKIKGPSKDWVKMVKTASARNRINSWFRKESRNDDIVSGKEQLEREMQRNGFQMSQVIECNSVNNVLRKFSMSSLEDLYASIGYGTYSANKIFGKLRDEYIKSLSDEERQKLGYIVNKSGYVLYRPKEFTGNNKSDIKATTGNVVRNNVDNNTSIRKENFPNEQLAKPKSDLNTYQNNGILVDGLSNCVTYISHCCSPTLGDEIIGYVRKSGGVSIHRKNCSAILNIYKHTLNNDKNKYKQDRLVKVKWKNDSTSESVKVILKVVATNGRYLLSKVTDVVSKERVMVTSFMSQPRDDFTSDIKIVMEVYNRSQVERLIGRLKGMKDVIDVVRATEENEG